MKRNLLSLITSGCLLAAALPASAQLSLYLQPATSPVTPGGDTTVDLMVSGISGMGAPVGLAAFAVEVNYDNALVSPTAVAYGTHLGATLDYEDLASTPLFISSTSLEAAGFFASQPNSFSLATLTFHGLASGTSALTFGNISLSDENGRSISIQQVPEPGQVASMLMVVSASGGFLFVRRLRRKA